jgi:two-component system, LytTR family, response regulator
MSRPAYSNGSSPTPAAGARALIIDDDSLARDLLRYHLERIPAVRVTGQAGTLREARTALARTDYDVVFLDVQLVGASGFDLVPLVRGDASIVFITGRDDHAVRAFEVNALDYIVKPVTAPRLAAALARLASKPATRSAAQPRFAAHDTIFLPGAAGGGRFAPIDGIAAIVSAENYSEALLKDGERWCVRRTMRSWEHVLPGELFARVHRTAIVNTDLVERIERNGDENTSLFLRGIPQRFLVSRRVWKQLKAHLAAKRPS